MENNLKISVYKKYIKYFFIFFIIFFLGLLTERFDIDNKISSFFKNSTDSISRFLYSFYPKEKIYINIKQKHYEVVLKNREDSLKKNRATEDIHQWVPAQLVNNKKISNIKIRLKGVFPDHWIDNNKWSFKIKVNNDSKSIFDLRRFAIQPPDTLSYLYEWLFMKALEKEKLINLRVKYLDVVINESSRGAYILQEQISEELLQNNNRKDGPIIGLGQDLWIKEANNTDKFNSIGLSDSLNGLEDSFWRAKIKPVQFSKEKIGTEQEVYLKKAIFLLESFRNGSLKPSQVFDTDQLAKVMALRALIGSSEFDWMDTKFYYNPKTLLLEPISKEAHVDLNINFEKHYFSWWIDSSKVRPFYIKNTNFFLDLLYQDKEFYKKYLFELNKMSEIKYFEDLIKENIKDFKKYKRILTLNYPTKRIFSKKHLEITRIRVQDFLNPIQGLNSSFINYEENILSLDVHNLQRLPVEILGIEFKDKSKSYIKKVLLIDGKKPMEATKSHIIKIDCEYKEECKKLFIKDQKLIFKILGQEKEKKAEISQY